MVRNMQSLLYRIYFICENPKYMPKQIFSNTCFIIGSLWNDDYLNKRSVFFILNPTISIFLKNKTLRLFHLSQNVLKFLSIQ